MCGCDSFLQHSLRFVPAILSLATVIFVRRGSDDISLVRAMVTRFKAQESDRLESLPAGGRKLYCIQAVRCIAGPPASIYVSA